MQMAPAGSGFLTFITHSAACLNDMSTAHSKATSPYSAIYCFLFQFTVAHRFLKVIEQLLTSSSSSFRHFSHSLSLSFNNKPSKAVATQDVTSTVSLLLFVCGIFLSALTYRLSLKLHTRDFE
jgi:hypothetical protein